MSSQWDMAMSFLATEMILSSSSPWSIMRITPITLAYTRQRGSTRTLHNTRISSGSLSSQQVCGIKPQLEGQCTALKRTRSSLSNPLSLSNSYLTLLSMGISMIALTIFGQSFPQGTQCHGFFVKCSLLLPAPIYIQYLSFLFKSFNYLLKSL